MEEEKQSHRCIAIQINGNVGAYYANVEHQTINNYATARDKQSPKGEYDDLFGDDSDDDMPLSDQDERVRKALEAVEEDNNFRHLYDWAWVRVAMMDERVDINFDSSDDFIDYLRRMGVTNLPCRSALNKKIKLVRVKGDSYNYTDTNDHVETTRRNNIARRFISAYLKNT